MKVTERISGWWLLIAAVLIGVLVITGVDLAFSLLTGRPFSFADGVAPFQMVLVAFPFMVLALLGARQWLPWLAGLVPTLALWGWYLFKGVNYQWHPDGSGADIGLGLILLASPLVISAICVATFVLQQRSADRPA